MNPKNIALCITTSYPGWYSGDLKSMGDTDKVRGDIAIETIQDAVHAGYHVFVSYSTQDTAFSSTLRSLNLVHLHERTAPKRSPSRREILQIATGQKDVKVLVMTEAEKFDFVKTSLETSCKPILEGNADIVVPSRDTSLFKETYPSYMYHSEIEGNLIYNHLLRAHHLLQPDDPDLDMFFGPRLCKNTPEVVNVFLETYQFDPPISYSLDGVQYPLDPEEYGNTLYFPILLALQRGLVVKSVPVPFHYPETQKMNEELFNKSIFMQKRQSQKIQLILECVYFLMG